MAVYKKEEHINSSCLCYKIKYMEKPLVSVIVPVYKAEMWLHRCVDSILAQTMKDFELLLIDDGSPDRSGEICDEYAKKDKRVKVIHQENKGCVGARNAGLFVAKGKYLAFVDSDDYIREDMLGKMVNVAEVEELDIVWCGVVGELKEKNVYYSFDVRNDVDLMIKGLLTGCVQGWLCNKLIKREFWDKCNIVVDERYCVFEDVLISLQLFYNRPKQGNVKEYFYVYNWINEFSQTSSGQDVLIKAVGNINLIYDFLLNNRIYSVYKREFYRLVMKVKFEYLNKGNLKEAQSFFVDAHKNIGYYPLSMRVSFCYWFVFNCNLIGSIFVKYKS